MFDRVGAVAAALLLIGMPQLSHAAELRITRVEVIIGLAGERVTACGVRAFVDQPQRGSAPQITEVELVNQRIGVGTEFSLVARQAPAAPPVTSLALATTNRSTMDLLGAGRSVSPIDSKRTFMASGAIDPTQGGFLMQELMLGGARIDLAFDNGPIQSWRVDGPLPQQVRAAYLHCAGDLFPRTR
jgi:hypothetical protein